MDILEYLTTKIESQRPTIVFPEGTNEKILKAAIQLKERELIEPVILGNFPEVQQAADQAGMNLETIEIIHPELSSRLEFFVDTYCQMRGMPQAVGHRIVKHPLHYAAMMVKTGYANGMVAGIDHPTEEVIMASELILGLEQGISVVSSFFLMDVPGFSGGENGKFLFSDPAVNPDPDPRQLADIALSTARSAAGMMGWEPRVAMLSFSTRGSASHPDVDKVIEATRLAQSRRPDLLIEGELQADAAIIPEVAAQKCPDDKLHGTANVLVFPDLDAGNICYKLVQRLTGGEAYGPLVQGLAKPGLDLSRGSTADEIVNVIAIAALRAGAGV